MQVSVYWLFCCQNTLKLAGFSQQGAVISRAINKPFHLPCVSFSDMEAATSTLQHSYGLSSPQGPNPPHGAQQAHGSSQPPPRTSRPEEQHHKPFFYIQPSQPYVPMQSLQWPVPVPMPVSYNPFFGYPGLGKCWKSLMFLIQKTDVWANVLPSLLYIYLYFLLKILKIKSTFLFLSLSGKKYLIPKHTF